MNAFAIIILAAVVLEFSLKLIGSLLNLNSLKPELPSMLQGIYKPEDYRKSQQYLRVTTRFDLVDSGFTLLLLLVFWFSGGFNWFDQVIINWKFIPLVSGLLYIGLLFFAYSLLKLPFSIYGTFVIEERFGFNKTTPRTFVLDQLKGLLLIIILGGLLLTGILTLFQDESNYAWLYCWGIVTIFSLALQYIAPTWIMPLFNKYKPLDSGELRDGILKYTRSVNFPVKNILVMDGSRRSSKSNAFFTGFGSNKRIALFDTLITQQTIPETVSVLAHEVGHYKKKHILQGTIIGFVHTGLIFFLLHVFVGNPGLYRAFYINQEPIYAGLLFFGLLYTPLELVLSIATQIISRKHEYQADRYAAETIDEPASLNEALKKLSANNLSNLTPHPFYVFLNYSHPPLLQRVKAIQGIKKKI